MIMRLLCQFPMQNIWIFDKIVDGIDFDGPPSFNSEISVEIPNTEKLSDFLQILQLNNIHDQDSECFGVDLFHQALQFFSNVLFSSCSYGFKINKIAEESRERIVLVLVYQ